MKGEGQILSLGVHRHGLRSNLKKRQCSMTLRKPSCFLALFFLSLVEVEISLKVVLVSIFHDLTESRNSLFIEEQDCENVHSPFL